MPIDVFVDAHEEVTRLGIREVVANLNRHLGATLVATLANVNDRKLPYRWARIDGASPGPEAANRLRVAHRIWKLLADAESDDIARAWFVGENPYLDEQPPVLALREGRLRDTLLAAQAFLEGSWQV